MHFSSGNQGKTTDCAVTRTPVSD